MMKLHITLESMVLQTAASAVVYVPYPGLAQKCARRVIWLLHCAFKDGNFFFDELAMGKYVDSNNCLLIAPSLGNSFFVNTDAGDYADFLSDELQPYLSRNLLGIDTEGASQEIVGISMGAFGALAWVLREPARFVRSFLISGVYNPLLAADPRIKNNREQKNLARITSNLETKLLSGPGAIREGCDLLGMVASTGGLSGHCFNLFCGSEDYMCLPQLSALELALRQAGLNYKASCLPGVHDRVFWEGCLRAIIEG